MLFNDQVVMDQQARITGDGYLVAHPRVSRIGIQDYLAGELGLTDRRPDEVIKVYRPPEEVFAADALHSLAHRPVTMDHPTVMVDASNWRDLSHGMTGDEVARDGDFVRVPMCLMDRVSIQEVMDGKRELSMGYTADLDMTPGKTENGEKYDAVQRNIRGNHLAIVDAARGGSKLRVIDNKQPAQQQLLPEEPEMKTIMLDGAEIKVDEGSAPLIERIMRDTTGKLEDLESKISDMEEKLKDMTEERDQLKKDMEAKDAQIATKDQQLADAAMTPEKLDAAVAARTSLVDSARKVLPAVVVDGKTDAEIRRQVVEAKLGDAAKDRSDDYVAASFDTLVAAAPAQAPRQDQFRQHHMDTSHQQPPADNGVSGYKTKLADAWKDPQPAKH